MRAWRTVLEVSEDVMMRKEGGGEGGREEGEVFDVVICTFLALRKLERRKEMERIVRRMMREEEEEKEGGRKEGVGRMPLPLLFLVADAWVWLGEGEEAERAFATLRKRVERYQRVKRERNGEEDGKESKKGEEEQQRWRREKEGNGGNEEGEEGGRLVEVLSQSMRRLALADAVDLNPAEVRWWLAKVRVGRWYCPSLPPLLPPSFPPSLFSSSSNTHTNPFTVLPPLPSSLPPSILPYLPPQADLSLLTLYLSQKSWRNALVILERVRRSLEQDLLQAQEGQGGKEGVQTPSSSSFASPMTQSGREGGQPSANLPLLILCKAELLSRIGRVFLQMGNLQEARRFFAHAEIIVSTTTSSSSSSSSSVNVNGSGVATTGDNIDPPSRPPSRPPSPLGWAEAQVGMGRGLMAVAEGRWEEASQSFEGVAAAERTRLAE